MKKPALLMAVVALAATSCAPKYNAAAQRPVSELNCTEIKTEFGQLQEIRSQAQSKSGLSKENVGPDPAVLARRCAERAGQPRRD